MKLHLRGIFLRFEQQIPKSISFFGNSHLATGNGMVAIVAIELESAFHFVIYSEEPNN